MQSQKAEFRSPSIWAGQPQRLLIPWALASSSVKKGLRSPSCPSVVPGLAQMWQGDQPLGMLVRGAMCHRVESLADKSCEAPGSGLGPKAGFEKGQLSPL